MDIIQAVYYLMDIIKAVYYLMDIIEAVYYYGMDYYQRSILLSDGLLFKQYVIMGWNIIKAVYYYGDGYYQSSVLFDGYY